MAAVRAPDPTVIVKMALVLGSSSLDPAHRRRPGTRGTEGWARTLVSTALDDLGPLGVVLHGGDALGPEAWAAAWAQARGLMTVCYALDGQVYADGCEPEPWTEEAPRRDAAWHVLRMRVLAAVLGRATREGDLARVLLLVRAGDLCGLDVAEAEARREGVEVVRRTCPAALLGVHGR